MQVVINSSPLIALNCINKIPLLSDLFTEIIIPQEVYYETVISGNDEQIEKSIKSSSKFMIKSVETPLLVEFLQDTLDKGESEVIALAKEQNISTVIIDELKGRRLAERHGLTVIGSLGILLIAKKYRLIPEVKELIQGMENNGIWIGKNLKFEVLKKANEVE